MGSVNPTSSGISRWVGRTSEQPGRHAPDEVDDLRGEEAELVPDGAGEVAEGRAQGGRRLLELEGPATATHLERQVRGDGVLLAHDELVVRPGRPALGF